MAFNLPTKYFASSVSDCSLVFASTFIHLDRGWKVLSSSSSIFPNSSGSSPSLVRTATGVAGYKGGSRLVSIMKRKVT